MSILDKDVLGIIEDYLPLTFKQKNEICKDMFMKYLDKCEKGLSIKTYRMGDSSYDYNNFLINAHSDLEAVIIYIKYKSNHYEGNFYDQFLRIAECCGEDIFENIDEIFENEDQSLKKLKKEGLPKSFFDALIESNFNDDFNWIEEVKETVFITIDNVDNYISSVLNKSLYSRT